MIKILPYSKLFILLILFNFQLSYAQEMLPEQPQHAFSNTWVFSVDGGMTLAFTDYLRTKPSGVLQGSVEYFFPALNNNVFGLRAFGTALKLAGEDDRPDINTKLGVRPLFPQFSTYVYSAGLAASYSYSIDDVLFPFIQAGASHIWFSPRDNKGNITDDNRHERYKKTVFEFDFTTGFRFLVSDYFSLNLSIGAHLPSTDFLENIAAGNNNDIYFTGMVGISFSPFVEIDSDGDGILDENDACPNQPEDFDGFEDTDGCPDLDNDGDGIPDVQDQCPDIAEDFDNFLDSDGCPEVDNDLDGIPDIDDKCPDQPEDFDGYLDDDGCPDLDNDGDGIPDTKDICPNQPENYNGFEDNDGCPDQIEVVSVDKMKYQAEEIFYNNSVEIRPE